MEEKTLFALRAPEIGEAADETQTVVSDGGELLIKIRSRKQKIVNGKVVETTTPSCRVTMGESWLSSRVDVDNQYNNILDVYFNIEKNISSSERTSVITVTQNESGKKTNHSHYSKGRCYLYRLFGSTFTVNGIG